MRRVTKAAAMLAAAFAAVAAACLIALAAIGYFRAPGMVSALERSGALALDPATLPPARMCALVAVQDRTFFRHHGLGLFDGPPLHTTLTQGLCKGLFFERFSPGFLRHRKFALMAYAVGFDLRVPKETQLRLFVNRAYLGNSSGGEVLGFAAAARAYFGRDLADLTDEQYLALVGMLVAPNTYHVRLQPEASAQRAREVEALARAACPASCAGAPPTIPCASVSD